MGETTLVYCGPAPTPATLMASWNLDIAAIVICAVIVAAQMRVGSAFGRLPLVLGVALLALLFLSPLCALTAALFSARAIHHILLVAAVAPLLALAFREPPVRHRLIGMGWVAAIQAVVFWFWHAPGIYDTAIVQPLAYWAMQLSLLGSAFWFWRRVLDRGESAVGATFALFATIMQMGMLGALLTFAGTPLYAPHLATTAAFGLSPLEDQQLAGILMWVPAALPYLAAALWRAWPLLGAEGRGAPWSG